MSRGRPTLTESKRPITFPNDDRRSFEVSPESLRPPLVQKSWLRTSYCHSPRYVPPREIPMTLAMLPISHAPFHSTFGRSESYQCMSGQLSILRLCRIGPRCFCRQMCGHIFEVGNHAHKMVQEFSTGQSA